jgi:hypothetical protein
VARAIRVLVAVAAVLGASAAMADEADVRTFLKTYLQNEMGGADIGPTKAAIAFFDLNADGEEEAIVYVVGSMWCGSGGCNALVLTPNGASFDVVMDASVTRTPLGVLDTSSNGWRDLFVSIAGGGIAAGTVAMKFDGKSYPDNPTVEPAEPVDASAAKALFTADERGSLL